MYLLRDCRVVQGKEHVSYMCDLGLIPNIPKTNAKNERHVPLSKCKIILSWAVQQQLVAMSQSPFLSLADPMAGSYGVMGDDSIDYTVHEAWNEATNVYLIVILVSFGLFMYAKR